MPKKKIPSSQRRKLILHAVIPIFARYGFHGATTKQLAEAAQVSESLLYKHFPSKESLYAAIFTDHLDDSQVHPGLAQLLAMPPSTERLVLSVQYFIVHMTRPGKDEFARLMTFSLLDDGRFASQVLHKTEAEFLSYFQQSLQAASQSGDIDPQIESTSTPFWFIHHLAMGLRLMHLPQQAAAPYKVPGDRLIDMAVRFALRGLGMRNTVIDRHLKSDPVAAWFS